jgi:hypothetical protein
MYAIKIRFVGPRNHLVLQNPDNVHHINIHPNDDTSSESDALAPDDFPLILCIVLTQQFYISFTISEHMPLSPI